MAQFWFWWPWFKQEHWRICRLEMWDWMHKWLFVLWKLLVLCLVVSCH